MDGLRLEWKYVCGVFLHSGRDEGWSLRCVLKSCWSVKWWAGALKTRLGVL